MEVRRAISVLARILRDDRGSTFIESGLWIAIVVLVMATAGYNLANTMKTKLGQINTTVANIAVPTIGP